MNPATLLVEVHDGVHARNQSGRHRMKPVRIMTTFPHRTAPYSSFSTSP